MSRWKLSVRVLNTAPIPHRQNRWIQADKNVEQSVESLTIMWEESIIQDEIKRAKPIVYLAQQNGTFEGCSV